MMRRRLVLLTFVFAGLILLSRPAYAATFCVTSELASATARAEAIFSGRITKVEPVEASPQAGHYFVTFKVETWWKGKPSSEMRVLWRSAVLDCPLLPVGEVGEDYLVYADPSRSTTKDQSPEVTFFNRTSRLPDNQKPEIFLLSEGSRQARISPAPELNRADASDDIKTLRVLRTCSCLSISRLTPFDLQLASLQSDSQEAEAASACLSCLRGMLKPF